ncbi:MAG: hypothetical protein ACREHD_19705 [Pirellulales bacterium]
MKHVALGALLASLGFFVAGCNDTARQKDKVERTVKTDQDTGKTTIKEEGQHTETDDQTGAKVETSVDKETTVKPANENTDGAGVNETTEPKAVNDQAAPDTK